MLQAAEIITEVEQAVASKDDDWRLNTLRRVSEMFLSQEKRVDNNYVLSFDIVLFVLSRNIETAARAALAERVADAANPLPELLKSLALDADVSVATPVLRRSEHLDEATLIKAASSGLKSHLHAIAGRRELSEAVTDVIVEHGDDEVMQTVAENNGARFSELGFSTLTRKARDNDGLLSVVAERGDLPANHFDTLLGLAKERARNNLEEDLGHEATMIIDDVIEGARLSPNDSIDPVDVVRRFQASEAYVGRRARSRRLEESDIVNWLARRQTEDVVAGLALMTDCPTILAVQAYFSQDFYPVLFMCRAAGLGWPTLKTILSQRAARQLAPETIESAYTSFARLTPQTARRVLRFVRLRAKTEA